ncbi:NADH dehydrogenase subunit 6 (mitochondrion) [Psammomys obesus]|uniref:NADH-ubiquinone oxidoreductase chain 6 n=1 Tax=Psammomys obesus TaxID=48139 RepID=A0A343W5R1_PSAOB|nr:NADH dehydrogenase subunit 6 [Psammomys obesus]AVW85933.1 NADH dehydrogenase subunit 6 [Psammomys obesus]
MTNYMFVLSLLFLAGCVGLALKPSPIYGGLVLVASGCLGCLTVLGYGGSFLGLAVFLIYLGGMMVVFGYTTAMASEEYPETWSSDWMTFIYLVSGLFMELMFIYVVGSYLMDDIGVEVYGMDNWVVYAVDEMGVMGEEGVGVAALYSCAAWVMIVAGWSLFVGVLVIVEITR